MTDLSILTLVRNRSTHLAELVEGLRRSDYPPLELIIVDMSDEPVATPTTGFPSSIIRLAGEHLPLSRARNLAARHANGRRLLFLDVDCIPMQGLIGEMMNALSTHDALICAPVRYLAAEDTANGWTEAALLRSGVVHPARKFPDSDLKPETNFGLFWSLAFGIRHETFDALGGFDESFTGYGAEDTDFGFRAREAGLPLLLKGDAGAFHQHHAAYDPPLQHFDDIVRNAALFQRRWGRMPMEGWLKDFEAMSLVSISQTGLQVIRSPSETEIKAARRPASVRF